MSRTIHHDSKEYVKVRVSDPGNGFDATLFQARVGDGDWRETEVLDSATGTARIAFICEPSADGLEPGAYDVQVRTVDNPEEPVIEAGILIVT